MAGSGYQQDSNQITPGLYRVTIDTSSNTYYPLASGTTTANGGVNPYDWTASSYTNATSMTATQATYLAQGNLRWQNILDQLDGLSDCRILNVVIAGATNGTDATTQNTSVAFTVEFFRDSFVLGEWNKILQSAGATANGTYTNSDGTTGVAYNSPYAASTTPVTTNLLAIKDAVTGAIIAGRSRLGRVWNPTQNGDSQVKVTVTTPNATASNIYGTVTVAAVSYTSLAGTPV